MKIQSICCPDMLKNDLDDQQMSAVEAPLRDTIVLAGPGSGKTRVLTCRAAAMAASGLDPQCILVLTFAGKAAAIVRERLFQVDRVLMKENPELSGCSRIEVSTIHSLAVKWIAHYEKQAEIIMPTDQAVQLMNEVRSQYLEAYLSAEEKTDFPQANLLKEILDRSLNDHKSVKEILKSYYPAFSKKAVIAAAIRDILRDYIDRLYQMKRYDLTLVLYRFVDLLNKPEVRQFVCGRHQHLLVDEYQDINWIQNEILQLLNVHHTMFVVGDMNQSIYRFRGARRDFVDVFKKQKVEDQQTACYFLSGNYRSTPEITRFCEVLMRENNKNVGVDSRSLKLSSKLDHGARPCLYQLDTPQSAARAIAVDIHDHYMDRTENVAIALRNTQDAALVQGELRKLAIPFCLDDKIQSRQEKKSEVLQTVLLVCCFLMRTMTLEQTTQLVSRIGIRKPALRNTIAKIIQETHYDSYAFSIAMRGCGDTSALAAVIQLLNHAASDQAYGDKLKKICREDLKGWMTSTQTKQSESWEEMEYYLELTKECGRIEDYLELIENYGQSRYVSRKKGVTIIGALQCKGREWDYLYLFDVTEGRFPVVHNEMTQEEKEEIFAEERRILYMLCSRAKKFLCVTWSLKAGDHAGGISSLLAALKKINATKEKLFETVLGLEN